MSYRRLIGNEREDTHTLAFFSEKVLDGDLDIVERDVRSSGGRRVCFARSVQCHARAL